MTSTTFGARFREALEARGPLCVGIDPHPGLLRDWGLDDTVEGLERFALTVVEAVAGEVSILKPQSAFYERFGSRGIARSEERRVGKGCVSQCRARGSPTHYKKKQNNK